MPPLRVLAVLLACALVPSAARAGDPPAAGENGTALRRDEALRLAAERNLSLLAQAMEPLRAAAQARFARRPYVPRAELVASGSEIAGENWRAINWSPSIVYTTPYGTTLTVQGTFVDGRGDNPQSTHRLDVEVSQGLLQNGFHAGASADLAQADLDVSIQKQLFRQALGELLLRADRAYWDLASRTEDLAIKRRSRDRAQAQLEETQENIRRGLLAPGEVYIVEESLADFDERLSRAEESLALAEVTLSGILHRAPEAKVRAASPLDGAPAAEPPLAESISAALRKSPAVLAARFSVQRAGSVHDGELGQALPRLDVFGKASVMGGTTGDSAPLSTNPALEAGVRLAVPLYWGPDAARVERAALGRRQSRLLLQSAEEEAETEVRQAAIRLHARARRLELAARLVDLAQKKLDVERDKYRSGISTLTDVVRFQRDLDASLSGSLQARVDLLKASAELAAARGDLDESLGIKVQ